MQANNPQLAINQIINSASSGQQQTSIMNNAGQIIPIGMPPAGLNPMQVTQQENDTASLPTAIKEWCRIQDEIVQYKLQIRERTRRVKALENFIMEIMKRNNIGALDLKSSGGRILYKKSKRTTGLSGDTLNKLLAEALKSEEKAQEVIKFITEHRGTKVSERLSYEPLDFE